jgi:ubiquitin C-terminal hydrolase
MNFSTILFSEIKFNTGNTSNDAGNNNNHNHNNNNNNHNSNSSNGSSSNTNSNNVNPKQNLCDPKIINLNWSNPEQIGGGLINLGNTCFVNSVLQCLTYCPPLYNYLIRYNGGHAKMCNINGFCMLCELEKHIRRTKVSNGDPIKPVSIVQRLKYINKNFQYGRQEDAHELLRYIIDHMWKACLINLDIKSNSNNKLDSKIKETTAINHIFGGYQRSQVLCLACKMRSDTYDYFMDLMLDIRGAKSLEEALKRYTQAETLDKDNAYRCGRCKREVAARKRLSVYKAPNVATFQFKRFDADRIFGGKITKFISYPEDLDLRPYMSDLNQASLKYQLNAVLVHIGHSSSSGHYYCFVKNSNGFWYRMDDSDVSIVNKNHVLQQQAYVLFYIRKASDIKQMPHSNGIKERNSINPTTSTNKITNSVATLAPAPAPATTSVTAPAILNLSNTIKPTNTIKSRSPPPPTPVQMPKTNGIISKPKITSIATWSGGKSQLEDDDPSKRKLNEITERDRFNEEIDQGKKKKIKNSAFVFPVKTI